MGPKLRSAVFKAPLYPLKRRRTKKLHRELLDQLEFYMSDANIRHDAFMREKAGDNGTNGVPISLFLSFPLIHEMKATEKNIIKALENSIVLELSEDKMYIHRRYPITSAPDNLDDSTLYIENLPPDCTIEWLKEVCQKTGTVRHVSLPRFKKSGKVKGFAFVEYSSPEDVVRACRIFKDPPKNFFPGRTRYNLMRIKRGQPSKTVVTDNSDTSAVKSEILTPESPHDKHLIISPAESVKRKRSCEQGATISGEEDSNDDLCHPPSLKKSRNNDTDTTDDKVTSNITTALSRKKKSVMFTLNRDNASIEQSAPCFTGYNGNASMPNEHVCRKPVRAGACMKTSVPKLLPEHCLKAVNSNEISRPTLVIGSKRRRSVSEPSQLSDSDEMKPKKLKAENDIRPLISQNPHRSTHTDIDAIISDARRKAELTLQGPESPKKPIIQSVIARPAGQVRHVKPKRRSKTSNERKRLREGSIPPNLSVMPKVEWMELKKEYKKLQKQNMSKLKMTIRENKDAGSVFIKKHLDVLHDVRIRKKSATGAHDDEDGEKLDIKEHSLLKRGAPRFQPGVIAKLSSTIESSRLNHDADLSPKLPSIEEIKTVLNQYGQGVAYVDLSPGGGNGFVRFNDGESAQRAIMEEKSLALCLLTGEQEEKYWDKLLASRARKFSQERRKIRGRTKILSKAEMLVEKGKRKHIRFDNDFVAV